MSLTSSPDWSPFGPVYEGRNYNLFSLFGSSRSDLPELKYGNFGIPDFLPITYAAYLKDRDYYGYVWWMLPDLKNALTEYLDLLRSPLEFYKARDFDFVVEEIEAGEFDVREYDEEYTHIARSLKDILKQIYDIENYADEYSPFIDIEKTVFLFYFDC